jgi:hypothetical protein
VPKNLKAAFARVQQGAQRFQSFVEEPLFGEKGHIVHAICNMGPDEWSTEKAEELRQSAEMLEELGATVVRNAKTLHDAHQHVVDLLGRREKAIAEQAEKQAAMTAGHELN